MYSRKKYRLPAGYTFFQAAFKSIAFLKDPIGAVTRSMERFSGTYSGSMGFDKKIIITQDPGFVSHVLKDNHKNYSKSVLSRQAARFMGEGLLFSNGDHWLRQRRMMQPAFHKEKLQGLYTIMIEAIAEELASYPCGKEIDVYPLVHRTTFHLLIQSIFHFPLPAGAFEEIGAIFTDLQEFLMRDTNQPIRKLFYVLNGVERHSLRQARRLREIIRGIVAGRKEWGRENERQGDLLDLLLNTRYEDTGEPMEEEQIIDEVLIMLFAGHETTANSLAWILYLLAGHPQVVVQLRAALQEKTIHECLSDEYLKAVIYEGMRLYPAAWMTERVALADDAYGDYVFPANTIIISFLVGLHRDRRLWADPLLFIPQRFIDDPKAVRAGNFFPFGAGPRMCIGNNFAIVEMSFFLYSFLKAFEIGPTGQVPEMRALITLKPDKVLLNIGSYR
jgi:cytochrome P450